MVRKPLQPDLLLFCRALPSVSDRMKSLGQRQIAASPILFSVPQPHLFQRFPGQRKELASAVFLFGSPLSHKDHPVADPIQPCQPVFCDKNCLFLLFPRPHDVRQLVYRVQIEVRGRFIHHDDLRRSRRHARAGDLLLFSTGKLEDVPVEKILDPHRTTHLIHSSPYLLLADPLVFTPKCDLACRVNTEKLASRILKDAAHISCRLLDRRLPVVLPADAHFSGKLPFIIMRDQPVDQPCHRGLAAPGLSAQQHTLARRDLQRKIPQRSLFPFTVAEIHLFDSDHTITPSFSRISRMTGSMPAITNTASWI